MLSQLSLPQDATPLVLSGACSEAHYRRTAVPENASGDLLLCNCLMTTAAICGGKEAASVLCYADYLASRCSQRFGGGRHDRRCVSSLDGDRVPKLR
jgi:hypothetical protein